MADRYVSVLMTLSDFYPGFKVTGYLKVEYLADGARVFNCTKHSCRSLGALPKTCKKLGSSLNFLAKTAGRCFIPVMEIKPKNLYSSLKRLRKHTAYQRKVLATTMDA